MISEEERKEVEELKSLLYRDSITQYGKRKLINLYENLIETQNKMIGLMAEYIEEAGIMTKAKFPFDMNNENGLAIIQVANKQEILEYFRNKAKESENEY